MNARYALPSSAALLLMTTLAWWAVAFQPVRGVQVVNHSGQILGGLSVCRPGGACLRRATLWPHQSWTVPMTQTGEVQVAAGGQQAVLRGGPAGLHVVIREGGRITAARPLRE